MRKQAVTVRLPVARIAPANKTLACSQTGLEKSGANSTIRGNNSAGSMGIWKPSLGGKFFLSLCGLPLLFQRSKIDVSFHDLIRGSLRSFTIEMEGCHEQKKKNADYVCACVVLFYHRG